MNTPRTKQLAICLKSSGTPDETQLQAIRQYTLRDFEPEELMVREFVLCHNCIDRDNEVFDEGLLADFERTLPGKGVHIRHPGAWDGDSGPGEGRVFGARRERMTLDAARTLLREPTLNLPPDRTEAELVFASAYFVRTDENRALLMKLDAGIAGDVSVGFAHSGSEMVRDTEGREMRTRRWRAPGEAQEMSLVWLGAQPGARAVKNAPAYSTHEDEDMELKEQLTKAQTRVTELETETAGLKQAASQAEALKTALGDNAELAKTPEKLAELAAAGAAYRDDLVDQIVKGERLAGACGDSEDDVKARKAVYANSPLSTLKALAKGFESISKGAGQINGGSTDPERPAEGQGGTAAKAVTKNPLFAA